MAEGPERNKVIARRFFEEVVNTERYDRLHEFIAPDHIDHNAGPEQARGPEGVRQHLIGIRTTFPDFHVTIDELIAEGDKVVSRVTGRGTHQGTWMSIHPTGKRVTVTGINIHRVAGGKLAEHWGEADTVAMLQQMGIDPFRGQT